MTPIGSRLGHNPQTSVSLVDASTALGLYVPATLLARDDEVIEWNRALPHGRSARSWRSRALRHDAAQWMLLRPARCVNEPLPTTPQLSRPTSRDCLEADQW